MGGTKGFNYRTERWFDNGYGKIIKNIITQHPVAGGKGIFHISHFVLHSKYRHKTPHFQAFYIKFRLIFSDNKKYYTSILTGFSTSVIYPPSSSQYISLPKSKALSN